jgi:xanthine dehydrogenase accessory factor
MLRHELREMEDFAGRLLASGTPGIMATLLSTRGSSYRSLGSVMVGLPGLHTGGISGGCLEAYVIREGERATRDTGTTLLQFHAGPDADEAVPALGCGGEIEILVERVGPTHLHWLTALREAYDQDTASLAVYDISKKNGVPLVRRSLHTVTDRPRVSTALTSLWAEALRSSSSRHGTLATDHHATFHYIAPLTRLVIVGAGDDAQPLCSIAHTLGWHVAVIDRRARMATSTRFPEADAIGAGDWSEVIEETRFTEHTAVILMTHSLE